jgi:hypothetical protein
MRSRLGSYRLEKLGRQPTQTSPGQTRSQEMIMSNFYSRTISRILALALIGLATGFCVLLSTPADAKTKGSGVSAVAVAQACNRTAGCSYAGTPAGHMTGCSPNACFDCNKGKCHPLVKKGPTGTTGPGVASSAGSTSAANGSATSQNNKPITTVHQPVALQHSGGGHSGGSKH